MRAVALILLIFLGAAGFDPAAADTMADRRRIAPDYDRLVQATATRPSVSVIVRYRVDPPDGRTAEIRREAGRRRLDSAMARHGVFAAASLQRFGMSVFFVDREQLDALIDSGFVDIVWQNKVRKPHLVQSNALISTDVARIYGLDGNGAAVAILDTGIDADHPTFDDRIVWEACFSTTYNPYQWTNLCPNGSKSGQIQYTQTGPGAAALTKCIGVDCFHGTHVASIAAGENSTYTGMAPAADIIAIQVFTRFGDDFDCGPGQAPCLGAFDWDIIAALEYVAGISGTFNIAAVNMSLGGGQFLSVCNGSDFTVPVETLTALDILVVSSSGNDGFTNALGEPACVANVVSVGSVNDVTDQVSSFSNSAAFLDILAPGESTTAAYPGGTYVTAFGTSMSSPHVAGAATLLKAQDGSLTAVQMKSLLTSTGTPVLDNRNGLTSPRLDLAQMTLALFDELIGDANDDGVLDAADRLLVQHHVMGTITLDATAVFRCDVYPAGNRDGVLDIGDLLLLEQLWMP